VAIHGLPRFARNDGFKNHTQHPTPTPLT
jgi:hypothetical protein